MTDEEIAAMYRTARTFAIVGASADERRDSNQAMRYLAEQGYRVLPVNPKEPQVRGVPAVATVAAAGEGVDVVVAFRRADLAPEVARDAAAAGAKVLWLPLGVASEEARAIAGAAGIGYVEDRCVKATHRLMKRAGML